MVKDAPRPLRGAAVRKGSAEPSAPALPLPGVETEEERLVREAQGGDVLAMSRLMDALAPWIATICGSIALEQADDAAQEALVQVFRDLRTLRQPAALRGWARRIAVREAVRHAQRARADRAREGEEAAAELPGDSSDPALAADVRAVLARLAPDQRAILVLRDLEGLAEEEAAAELGVAKGTVKSRLSRAREAFAKRWSA